MDIPEINLEISKKIQRLSNLYDVEIQVLGREGASKERLDEARIRKEAFAKASKALANYPLPLKDIKPAGIPGVGKSSVEIIKQYLKKGSSDRIDEMEEKYGVMLDKTAEFKKYYGMGPKKAFDMASEFSNLESVPKERLTTQMKTSMKQEDPEGKIITRDVAEEIETKIQNSLEGCTWKLSGSYRRGAQEMGDLDLIVADCDLPKVIKKLKWLLGDQLSQGAAEYKGYTKEGYRIDISTVSEGSYYYALLHSTGSGDFNKLMREKAISFGLLLSQHGLYDRNDKERLFSVKVESEKEIFYALDLKYLPPSKRVKGIAKLEGY